MTKKRVREAVVLYLHIFVPLAAIAMAIDTGDLRWWAFLVGWSFCHLLHPFSDTKREEVRGDK